MGRYRIVSVLGRGASSVTYEATELGSGKRVAMKALSLRGMSSWKSLDLFEREARMLETLSHPAVPTYVDSFEADVDGDRVFLLVQNKAEGKSLQVMLDEGVRLSTKQIESMFRQLLEVLGYLGELNPPVLHRDVKPGNIIIDIGSSAKSLKLSLVDFGGVNTGVSAADGSFGSTMIGTFGFMAPEQFGGSGDVRSDMYAAGATILYALTGRPPSSLPQKRLKIDTETIISPGERLKLGNIYTVMQKLLEPAPEDRYATADDALDALNSMTREKSTGRNDKPQLNAQFGGYAADSQSILRAEEAASLERAMLNMMFAEDMDGFGGGFTRGPSGWMDRLTQGLSRGKPRRALRKPAGSRVIMERDRSNRLMRVTIPPRGFSGETVSKGAFAAAWTGFTAFWTVGVLTGGAPIVFSLFSLPFWVAGARLAKSTADDLRGAVTMVISVGGGEKEVYYFSITTKGAFGGLRVVEGDARDLLGALVDTEMYVNGRPVTALLLREGTRRHAVGAGLDPVEQEWLRQEINSFLESQP